jgi:hypothetical protein
MVQERWLEEFDYLCAEEANRSAWHATKMEGSTYHEWSEQSIHQPHRRDVPNMRKARTRRGGARNSRMGERKRGLHNELCVIHHLQVMDLRKRVVEQTSWLRKMNRCT